MPIKKTRPILVPNPMRIAMHRKQNPLRLTSLSCFLLYVKLRCIEKQQCRQVLIKVVPRVTLT